MPRATAAGALRELISLNSDMMHRKTNNDESNSVKPTGFYRPKYFSQFAFFVNFTDVSPAVPLQARVQCCVNSLSGKKKHKLNCRF